MSADNLPRRGASRNAAGTGKDPGPDHRDTVHAFNKNATQQVLASLADYRGRTYIDLRVFYRAPDGEYCPTRKGIMIAVGLLAELEEAVAALRAAVDARGLAA